MTEKVSKPKKPLVFSSEQKILSFLEKHLYIIAFAAVTILAIVIRHFLMDFVSGDAHYFLLPWYETIKPQGFAALSEQVGDYNMLYQFFVALFTYLPIDALHAYKLFSIIFDFLLAILGAWIIYKNSSGNSQLKAVLMYAFVLLSPLVFLNSSAWAQCDVIYTYFCVFSLYMMYKDKYLAAMILFAAALTFKLQAIFILPLLLFCYFAKKKFSFLYFLTIPAVMILLSLPGILSGRSVADVFTIYFNQTSTYKAMSMNYPSFWTLFQNGKLNEQANYGMFSKVAVILTLAILLLYLLVWLKKRVALSYENLFSMAFLLVYTCVLFLPSMHERYGFLYEILGLFIALRYYKTIPLLLLSYSVSIISYSLYLFTFDASISRLSFLNLVAYAGYAIYLNKQMFKNSEEMKQPTVVKTTAAE